MARAKKKPGGGQKSRVAAGTSGGAIAKAKKGAQNQPAPAAAASSSSAAGNDPQLAQYTDDQLTNEIATQQAALESIKAAGNGNQPEAEQLEQRLRAMKAELERRRQAALAGFGITPDKDKDKDDGDDGDDGGDELSDLPVLVVCDDQRDAHTWDEMWDEMGKIRNAHKERKAFVGKRATRNKVKLFDVATSLLNQSKEKWKKDHPGRGEPPDDVKAKLKDAAARVVYPGPYLANLPEYKCMARAPTREEKAARANMRELINDIRLSNDGAHRELGTEPLNDHEFLALGELIGAPTTLPSLAEEYVDFMNEERRDIIGTIRRARLRLRHEPRTEDLEEQEAIDQWELYEPLFQDETLPTVGAAKGGDAHSASVQNIVQGDHVRCLGTPRVAWDGDGGKDPGAEAGAGDEREWKKREDEAGEWIYERIKDGNPPPNRTKAGAKGKQPKPPDNPLFKAFDTTVNPLADQNGCRPCKVWKLFVERDLMVDGKKLPKQKFKAPGYYQGIMRVMQVRNEIGLSQHHGHVKPEYQYNLAFHADPFIESGALDALYKKHVGEAEYNAPGKKWARAETVFKTELLRCYPVAKAAGDPSLNRIVDFLCWYHINIVLKGIEAHEQEGKSKLDVDQHQQDLLYRALCCPNCRGKDPYQDETEELLVVIRRAVHDRVQQLNTYFKRLTQALDDDVLKEPDNAKSFLWNFKATDPVISALVRNQIYNRWAEMNPRNS